MYKLSLGRDELRSICFDPKESLTTIKYYPTFNYNVLFFNVLIRLSSSEIKPRVSFNSGE